MNASYEFQVSYITSHNIFGSGCYSTPSEGMSDLLIIENNLTISSTSNLIIDFSSDAHLYISM